jgi:flagellar biosynthesis protein
MKKNAVAIKYSEGDHAPKIIAKGKNRLADLIVKIALENDVVIEEHRLLSEALMQFDVGEYIPEEMYEIVAQILAYVYRVVGKR